jgi:hypothetical protein
VRRGAGSTIKEQGEGWRDGEEETSSACLRGVGHSGRGIAQLRRSGPCFHVLHVVSEERQAILYCAQASHRMLDKRGLDNARTCKDTTPAAQRRTRAREHTSFRGYDREAIFDAQHALLRHHTCG